MKVLLLVVHLSCLPVTLKMLKICCLQINFKVPEVSGSPVVDWEPSDGVVAELSALLLDSGVVNSLGAPVVSPRTAPSLLSFWESGCCATENVLNRIENIFSLLSGLAFGTPSLSYAFADCGRFVGMIVKFAAFGSFLVFGLVTSAVEWSFDEEGGGFPPCWAFLSWLEAFGFCSFLLVDVAGEAFWAWPPES